MAAITHVTALACVAQLLGEDLELLEAIVENDDNLTYGSIVSVYTGQDEGITALTDDGHPRTERHAGERQKLKRKLAQRPRRLRLRS